ncbi:MarR family winged helix-turn-helix transcriptional regulator [Solirhodobacter olei]|uniref:MarR family winged helix-turn-helix transcriptional regulator n=1 Tax=Solirhodobacter olei TaxID=2493082 RepID=UPI000FDB0664|nr:MarR family winged helix-turn-helix transcriptional regulator [Solirhodobacter olei]
MPDDDLPPLPGFDLDHFTPYRLSVAAERVSEELARVYRERFGLSIPQWRVLVHLASSGDVSVREIEARVAMEKSKVSRAASRLEAAGLIGKTVNDADRRLVRLSLTAKGRALMAELLPLAEAYQREIEARLGASFAAFAAGLETLLGARR